jgi:hypothetical protein
VFAVGDSDDDADPRYLGPGLDRFRGFRRRRARFVWEALKAARTDRYDVCLALHANLASVTALGRRTTT